MTKMLPLKWIIISLALTYHLVEVNSHRELDLIKSFPGQPSIVNFQQYGGYVPVDETRNFFYYFVEAETNPETKPLVLWLNGGPGCSSLGYGGFNENGPFRPTSTALVQNPHSWNKVANMLYVESPAGVGFSYSTNKSYYSYVDDEMTARDNLEFLKNWLVKFPEYMNRDFFIAGESYAGHYVPHFANLVLKSNLGCKLKGIALGNPLLEFNDDFNSRGMYLWSHGLISDETFGLMQTSCNYSQIRSQALKRKFSPECAAVNSRLKQEFGDSIDRYDITINVCLKLLQQEARSLHEMEQLKADVCLEDKTTMYFNRKDVQEAIHAKLVNVDKWVGCSGAKDILQYHWADLENSAIPSLKTLLQANIPVWIFSGDQDTFHPFIGSRTIVGGLAKQMNLNTTIPYRSWLNLDDGQAGGYTQVYGDILTFATVRGAGHETSFSQPARSFALFSAFLQGKPLAPPPPKKKD